ncbi:MAG: hypothetical protein AB7O45_08975 [Alphaproteobacteria bacterium]
MRKTLIALTLAGMAGLIATPAFADACDSKMTELKPRMAQITDASMKSALDARFAQAEAAMKAKDGKACMEHLAFIERALKDGKM